jgi:glycosyltransferase involved in cell wall biosynthesis
MAAAIPHARLVIVGVDPQGTERGWVERLAQRAGASNILLRPRVPLADVAPYLYAADCLVIPPTGDPLHRFVRTVLPLKVFSYLAAGRPILAPRLPDIEEVLTDGETARLVPPDSAAAARALAEVLADGAMQERLGRNALSLSVGYTWSHRAETITRFLSELPMRVSRASSLEPRVTS